jgi:NitT/TauT family transport system ATP-binding protein
MSALELSGIGHAYLGRTVIDGLNLRVAQGEVVALVGPSGCGKSTALEIAAGLIEPLRGRVHRGYARHGVVFQEPHLMPWARARDNIAYPLRLAGVGRGERRARAEHAAARAALDPEDLDKYPAELSGGMKQRVGIARALVVEPDFMFFDEPFTALDVALKRHLQDVVIAAAKALQFAAVFVTHDLMEAQRIAHRIAVMDARGAGLTADMPVAGEPGGRDDFAMFQQMSKLLANDPRFRHLNDVEARSA